MNVKSYDTPNAAFLREKAPFRAVIEFDVWAWKRAEGWKILEQLVSTLEKQETNRGGGLAVHHEFVRSELKANG